MIIYMLNDFVSVDTNDEWQNSSDIGTKTKKILVTYSDIKS